MFPARHRKNKLGLGTELLNYQLESHYGTGRCWYEAR